MIKGDKIKLVKPMGMFTNIGEICEVIDVNEGGVISFKFGNGLHLGCMSYDEFLKYFEMIEEKTNRTWTEWQTEIIKVYNQFNVPIMVGVNYRHNGKKVQVKANCGIKAESSCNKCDEFDFEKGFKLAASRFKVKYLSSLVKTYANSL